MGVFPACKSVHHLLGDCGGQRRALDPLGLDLSMQLQLRKTKLATWAL